MYRHAHSARSNEPLGTILLKQDSSYSGSEWVGEAARSAPLPYVLFDSIDRAASCEPG